MIAKATDARQVDRNEILSAGYQACLTKPIDATELAAEIGKVMRESAKS